MVSAKYYDNILSLLFFLRTGGVIIIVFMLELALCRRPLHAPAHAQDIC
jgi:hypothetical protein